MKRRIVAVFMALTMTVGMLAGCGEKTEEKQTDTKQSVSETGSQASVAEGEGEYYTDENGNQIFKAADGKEYYVDKDGNMYQRFDDVTLTLLWDWNGGAYVADDQYNNEIATLIREKIGVTVEYEEVYVDETEKLNMVFAGGDMPDIIEAPYWGGGEGTTGAIKTAAEDGLLIDISEYYKNYNYLYQAFEIGNISQAYWNNDINVYDGSLYVMPARLDGSIEEYDETAYAVCVRQDVAETLGVDPTQIKTAEQLYDFMKAADEYGFKDVNGNDTITLGTFHNGNYFHILYTMFSDKRWTDYLLDADGNVIHEYLDEEFFIDGSLYIWKLVHEGLMDVECFNQSKDLGKQKAGNGSVLFIAGAYGTAIDSTIETGLYDTNPEMRYVYVGPLSYKSGESYTSLETAGATGSHVYLFPETCSNIEAALTYIDYISSPEGYLLRFKGVEGKDFTFDENGKFTWNPELVEMKQTDKAAYDEYLRVRGLDTSGAPVAYNRNAWYGDMSMTAQNEYEAAWEETVPVEFPKEGTITIDTYASDYEKYQDVTVVLGMNETNNVLGQAFFADTEEEAEKILRNYQEKLKKSDVFMDFLQYMTDCYNADPDGISF